MSQLFSLIGESHKFDDCFVGIMKAIRRNNSEILRQENVKKTFPCGLGTLEG